jgi:tetratricopeptide (TPR) repeat protein
MPRKEDIERFTQVLNSLGDEPAIRAARSETIEAVAAPDEEAQEGGGALPGGESETVGDQEDLQSLFDSLSALPGDEAPAAPEAASPAGPSGAAGASGEGMDFASLFGEEAEPEGLDTLSKPRPPKPAGRKPKPAPEPAEDAFSLPEGDLEGLQSDLSQMEVLPEDLETPAAGAGAEPAAGAEPDAFADLGSFTTDFAEAGEPGAEGETAPGPGAPDESADGLPNLDDLSFTEPLESASEAGPPGEPSFEEPAAAPASEEMPSFEEPAPSGAEEMPSFEEPTLSGAGEMPSFEEPTAAPASEEMPSFEEPAPSGAEEMPSFEEPAAAPASEEMPALGDFDLDASTFEAGPTAAEAEQAPAEEPSAEQADGLSLDIEEPGEERLEEMNLDEFSLPESAGQFGVQEAAPPEEPKKRPAAPARAPARQKKPRQEAPAAAEPEPEMAEAAPEEISLTPEQFAQLKRTLESLPRNLKIAVQDLIGQGTAVGADLSALIALLIKGASAQEIAARAGRILGKKIRIPEGYEKKSGVAFEAESRTFGYALRENILPLLRVVAITIAVGGLFGFFCYRYVYQPLSALSHYRAGYAQIANDRYAVANERFARAVKTWPMKNWFYRYAEAFAAKRQYILAEQKYEELLQHWAGDHKGILDYARMESQQMSAFKNADDILKRILDTRMYDYDALLLKGDNDLLWGESVKGKYESARLAFATLIEKYGAKDELLFRMLRYFIRTDNGLEVERLRMFYASRPDVKIDAAAFAELGGYLVDHRRLDWAQETLLRAEKNQPGLAEVHYNLARYYNIIQNPADEKKALDHTVRLMKDTDLRTRTRVSMEIDTHTRLGQYHYNAKEYITAEKELQTSLRLIAQAQATRLIGRERMFGRPYAALGDLYYYVQGDISAAARQYQSAIGNRYTSPELTYKMGWIQYAQKDFGAALKTFTDTERAVAYPSGEESLAPAAAETGTSAQAALPGQVPQNLLYATANAFYQRKDYFAAQGSYLRMLDRLETRRAMIGRLHPEDTPGDRSLMESLVKVNNNLGVTMIKLGERTGDRRRRSEGLVYLTAAAEMSGILARNPDSVTRSETRGLASLNMKEILYPTKNSTLMIYEALPKDFTTIDW